ncbi:hypothetical protein L195_g046378, partial [Trifolium pratense]
MSSSDHRYTAVGTKYNFLKGVERGYKFHFQ